MIMNTWKVQQQNRNNRQILLICPHPSYMFHPVVEHQRLRQIQKSNLHVKNLIESAKRMIYQKDGLSKNEKQILQVIQLFLLIVQVKISIEKDHLKNSFYKINCPDNTVNLQIIEQHPQTQQQLFKHYHLNNSPKSTIKLMEATQFSDHEDQNRYNKQQTKIVISRIVEKESPSAKRITAINSSLSGRQSQFSEAYQRGKDTARTYTIEEPENNRKIVIKTSQEPVLQNDDQLNMMGYQHGPLMSQEKKHYYFKDSGRQSSPKTQRFQITQYLNRKPCFEQEINLSTPERTYKIKTTQVVQNFNHQQPLERKMENQHQQHKLQQNSAKFSEKSTSYKEILQKNKSKLQDSREKSIQNELKSPSYKLDLQKLYEKRQEGKKRLYGQHYENKSSQLNSGSGSHVKYSIANSQRSKKQESSNLKSGQSTNREKSKTLRSNRSQLSQQKNKNLHSTLIKGIHMPCTSPCSKCKSKVKQPKQKQEPLSSFHLAKKYLTPQGQQQCYNFLRSQGIQQKDWPIFITEYVYRQLSKAYNEYSSKHTQQKNG